MKRINIIFFFLCFFFYLSAPAYSQANLDSLAIASESGDAEDLYQLGRAYDEACALLDYSDSKYDIYRKQAASCYKAAAEQGHTEAQRELASCYIWALGVGENPKRAVYWFNKAIEQGDIKAKFELAELYDSRQNLFEKNEEILYKKGNWYYQQSDSLYKEACEQVLAGLGDADDKTNLALCYLNGYGVERDSKKAAHWFLEAAKEGSHHAQMALGYSYLNGNGVEQNYKKAFYWLSLAAPYFPAAERGVAECYYHGWGVKKDYEKALSMFLKLVDYDGVNYGICSNYLGLCYENGFGNYAAAVSWYQKAAEARLPEANYNLGICYAEGRGVAQDYVVAFYLLQESAAQGYDPAKKKLEAIESEMPELTDKLKKMDPEVVQLYVYAGQGYVSCLCELGDCYAFGKGVAQDYAAAASWYRKAAEQGDAGGQYNLGLCYYNGQGVAEDREQAIYWAKKAAEQGWEPAKEFLEGEVPSTDEPVEKDLMAQAANMFTAAGSGDANSQYILGLAFIDQSQYSVGAAWLTKAAEQGHAEAQYVLGALYLNGQGVELDSEKGVSWIAKSAAQGYAEAQSDLGVFYEKGLVVEKNDAKAVSLYMKAAKQGLARAQSNLGERYLNGKGVTKNAARAAAWFAKSAEQDFPQGQYNLAMCYAKGWGVIQNSATAIAWFRKAADNGFEPARQVLENLRRQGIPVD